MDASVVDCAYNRCASLADTLEAIAAMQVPSGFAWELIVVDNNSRDDTRATVEAFAARQPALSVRYLFQPQQGLSHARNLGSSAAQGETLVFTDDDVLPAPDWLITLVSGMREHGCSAAGGCIALLWLAPPPAWLTERFYGFLALRTDEGAAREVRRHDEMPLGASLAFQRSVFERGGNFDPQLGCKGSVLAGGEEIDVLMRIVERGERVMYFPQARVRHKVEAFRLSKRYLRRWRYQCSLNKARAWPAVEGRTLAGVPLYLFGQLLRSAWRTATMRLLRPADEAFCQEMIVWHFLGLIHGLAQRADSAAS